MTFSILVHDEESGALGAAAATGSLCVGGWVLRGAWGAGLVASQGTAPSTLWRDGTLAAMRAGEGAREAVAAATGPDPGRDHRQLAALDAGGGAAAFTGAASVPHAAHRLGAGRVAAGNMLDGPEVLDALCRGLQGDAPLPDRLLSGLRAAEAAGGDSRGLQSAAMLVLRPDAPPLDLRVDDATDPLDALARLLARTRASPYADWLGVVPVADDPHRAPEPRDAAE